MSAYVVDRNTVLYLVNAMKSKQINRHSKFSYFYNGEWHDLPYADNHAAAKIANTLWKENIKSVLYRYPNDTIETMPGPCEDNYEITFHEFVSGPRWNTFDPVQVLSTINCFDYQACEHPEWQDSEAYAIIKSLQADAIRALPGYDDAETEAPAPDYPLTPRKLEQIAKAKAEKIEAERQANAEWLSPTDTAKIVRKDLKAKYPGVKFSVRTHSGSSYASLSVHWTNGPTDRFDVWEYLSKYRKHFIFDFEDKTYRSGVEFISTNRAYTREFLQEKINRLWEISGDIKVAGAEKPEIKDSDDGTAYFRCPVYLAVGSTDLDTYIHWYLEEKGIFSKI